MGNACCNTHPNYTAIKMDITPSLFVEEPQPVSVEPEIDDANVVKIQAQFRGYLIRKSIKSLPQSKSSSQHSPKFADEIPPNPENTTIPYGAKIVNQMPIPKEILVRLQKLPSLPMPESECYQLQDGCYYKGLFKDQMKHGLGQMLSPFDDLYEGYFNCNQKSGFGRLLRCDGSLYIGLFANDEQHGEGEYENSQGYQYKGEWAYNVMDGEGIETTDVFEYKGKFKQGAKFGYGEMTWKDGSQYQGQFKNNRFDGNGTYHYADGKTYDGEWLEGRMHGQGCFEWNDQSKYIGSYVSDVKEGNGEFYYSNGTRYKGQWSKGKQHGKGVMISIMGDKREGEWVDGRRIRWV